jgi:hypothetical protein
MSYAIVIHKCSIMEENSSAQLTTERRFGIRGLRMASGRVFVRNLPFKGIVRSNQMNQELNFFVKLIFAD